MEPQRRADLIWIGEEVLDYERIRKQSEMIGKTVPEQIKEIIRNS